MISLETARELKLAGLAWTPALYDSFAVPDRGLDDKRFVLSDINVYMELLHGQAVVTFHGTSEWALDYETIAEVVWLPSEEQLRQELAQHVLNEAGAELVLTSQADVQRCEIPWRGERLSFAASEASEAYAAALLYVLQNEPGVS